MPMNSCVIQAHPSGPPKASGPFTSSSLHPTAWNTCGPILSKKDLCLLSSHAPHCPRLVPEGPCGTLSCNPCPLQVPTWLSLLLRPLPQQGTGKLCVGPWPAGHSLPDLNSLPWPKQRDCGAKPEPSEEGRPTPPPPPTRGGKTGQDHPRRRASGEEEAAGTLPLTQPWGAHPGSGDSHLVGDGSCGLRCSQLGHCRLLTTEDGGVRNS